MDEPTPLDAWLPSADAVVAPRFFCRSCDWKGFEPYAYDAAARRALLDELKPGDTVPAGACPECGGHAYPLKIFEGRLPSLVEDGYGRDWDISILRVGLGYTLLLTHPEGFGCEIDLEIGHERPRLEITPFNMPDEMLENKPVGHILIGEDQVVFTGNPNGTAAIVAEDGRMRTSLIINDRWAGLCNWSDQL